MKLSLIVLFLTFIVIQSATIEKNVEKALAAGSTLFCYFESWTIYRPDLGKFDVDNIDPNLCTHISFAFIGLNTDGTVNIIDPWEANPDGLDGLGRLVRLKEQNPNLKVIATMGGGGEESLKYSQVAADPALRAVLVQSVIQFLQAQGFDGFDLDWEYPAGGDSINPADKQNFVTLLQELKAGLSPLGYSLSVAVYCGKSSLDTYYDIAGISNSVDYINVMAYDFHGPWGDNLVGHHTLLYSSQADIDHGNAEWNIDSGISYWLQQGADPAKINMGIATYARTFTLSDPSNVEVYAPTAGPGTKGPYTGDSGILSFAEVCQFHSDVPDIYDDAQKVYHKVYDDQWIGYDNTASIATKVQYATEKNLGGFMVWGMDTDDFRGLCGLGEYPLINSIKIAAAKYKKSK